MGWYPDPADARLERYWDGQRWTRNTRVPPSRTAADRPPAAAGPMAPGGYPGTDSLERPGRYAAGFDARPMPYRTQAGFATGGGPTTDDGVRLAGWWSRLAALIVDYLLLTVVQVFALMLFGQRLVAGIEAWEADVLTAVSAGNTDIPLSPADSRYGITTLWIVYNVALLVAQFCYATLMMRFKAATIGQLLMGLRVVRAGHGRERFGLRWSTSLLRNAGWLFCQVFSLFSQLSTLGFVLTAANGLWPLFNPRRQALHDLLARTQVISVRP